MVGVASLVLATTRISALDPESGSAAGSSQPEARRLGAGAPETCSEAGTARS